MTKMANPVQTQNPAKMGENFYSTEKQNSSVQYNPDANNLQYVDKKDDTANIGRQGKIEEVKTKNPSKLSEVHPRMHGCHEKQTSPSPEGDCVSRKSFMTMGQGVKNTLAFRNACVACHVAPSGAVCWRRWNDLTVRGMVVRVPVVVVG